jgi:hypothetical protein
MSESGSAFTWVKAPNIMETMNTIIVIRYKILDLFSGSTKPFLNNDRSILTLMIATDESFSKAFLDYNSNSIYK